MKKMSQIYKIIFSAILIAISIILSRAFSINLYVIGIPFVKISFATGVIMFGSFYLGPIYGLIIAICEDIIGSLILQQGGSYNPVYTISVALGGLMPFLIYKVVDLIKIEKKFPLTLTISLTLISTFITLFCFLPNLGYIKSGSTIYTFSLWLKILLTSISWGLSILYIVLLLIIKNKRKKLKINNFYNINALSSSIFLTYALFKVPVSSLVFYLMGYEAGFIYFVVIFASRLLTSFLTAFIDLIFNVIALNISLNFSFKGSLLSKKLIKE